MARQNRESSRAMKQNPNANPHLKKIAIAAGIIGTLIGIYYNEKRRSAPEPRTRHEQPMNAGETRRPRDSAPSGTADTPRAASANRADFDFYLLAMTVHRAFCADGNDRKPECRAEPPRPLVIHGLWPEKLEPRSYPRDCPAAPVDLEPALARELATYMPGMQSGLHRHEWRKHGGCSGLDDDAYFRRTLELARHLDAALGKSLTMNAGGIVAANDLRAAAEALERGLGAALTFHCRTPRDAPRRDRPYLVEVRQCLDAGGTNGAPGSPVACASVNRRDQGCGARFRIAGS
jgi:ribonuclease I